MGTNGHDRIAPPEASPQAKAVAELAARARDDRKSQLIVDQVVMQRNAALDQLAMSQAECNALRAEIKEAAEREAAMQTAMEELRADLEALAPRVEVAAAAADAIAAAETATEHAP